VKSIPYIFLGFVIFELEEYRSWINDDTLSYTYIILFCSHSVYGIIQISMDFKQKIIVLLIFTFYFFGRILNNGLTDINVRRSIYTLITCVILSTIFYFNEKNTKKNIIINSKKLAE